MPPPNPVQPRRFPPAHAQGSGELVPTDSAIGSTVDPDTVEIDGQTWLDVSEYGGQLSIVAAMGGTGGDVTIEEAVCEQQVLDGEEVTTTTSLTANETDTIFGGLVGATTYLRVTATETCDIYIGGSA